MRLLLVLFVSFLCVACGTTGDYSQYLAAQREANLQSVANRKPMVLIEAQDGQPIVGLKRVEVYAPDVSPVIQQSRPSEWAAVANNALGVTGAALGIKLGGDAAIGLAGAVGKAANHGYSFVNPTPVVAPEVQVVRPEIVHTPAAQVVQPEVVQIPTQVIEQPTVITVPVAQ